MRFHMLAIIMIVSGLARAETFTDKVKVAGFHCDSGKAAIELRSFEKDYVMYLVENEFGDPEYLDMLPAHCTGLIKNLSARLRGKVFELDFQATQFSRVEQVYTPPSNPCRYGRTKCDDDGYFSLKKVEYEGFETLVDGYRFFHQES